MTPLAAGQRWVPTRAGSMTDTRIVTKIGGKFVHYEFAHLKTLPVRGLRVHFTAWIARHSAVLEQDGGGDGG
jgi:hypothetical protein